MASVKPELGATGLARVFLYLIKQIFPVTEPVGDDPRPDIRRYHQLDDPIRQPVRIVPAAVRKSFDDGREKDVRPQAISFAFC